MLEFKSKKIFINIIFFLKWNYFNLIYVILKSILIFNNKILMFAFLNYLSILKILFYKYLFYYSRSKNFLWFKGNKSGNFQIMKKFYIDCDMDLIYFYILQIYNKSCHTNLNSCIINKIL